MQIRVARDILYIHIGYWLQDLSYIELLAGAGNVFKCVKKHKIPAAALDIEYLEDPPCNNPMDINSPAGLACLC